MMEKDRAHETDKEISEIEIYGSQMPIHEPDSMMPKYISHRSI